MAGYVKAPRGRFVWNEVDMAGRVRVKGAPVCKDEVLPKRPELGRGRLAPVPKLGVRNCATVMS